MMKRKSLFIASAAAALLLASCGGASTKADAPKSETQTFSIDTNTLQAGSAFYQCEMHPAVISDKPGVCPECGMQLIEQKKQ